MPQKGNSRRIRNFPHRHAPDHPARGQNWINENKNASPLSCQHEEPGLVRIGPLLGFSSTSGELSNTIEKNDHRYLLPCEQNSLREDSLIVARAAAIRLKECAGILVRTSQGWVIPDQKGLDPAKQRKREGCPRLH
jgi:hypothetical protein